MAEQTWLSLSKVGELKGQKRQVKLSGVKVELKALDLEIRGEGADAFGFIIEEGEQLRMEVLGELANTTKEWPDVHQSVRPPLSDGKSVVTITKPPEQFGLFLNCLLYTSPSPRDKRQSRMPSSA